MYDSTGARVKKTAAGTTTIYLGKDYDIVGTLSTKYIFLGDRRVALKDSSGTKLFFHEDHINSSNIITDASGDQAAMYEYDPYGATVTQTGSAEVKHRFTGQEADDSTGLYYYGARYYDSQLGRFITPDWIIQDYSDPQTLNRYAYARNNPIKFTDPTGNFFLIDDLIAAVVIGAIIGAAVSAGVNAYQQYQNNGTIRLGELTKAALKGAVAGAAAGATAVVSAGAVGWIAGQVLTAQSGALLLGTFNAIGIVSGGSAAGYVGNGVGNALEGENFNKNAGSAAMIGGATAFLIGGRQIINGFKNPTSVYFYNTLKQQGLAEYANTRSGGTSGNEVTQRESIDILGPKTADTAANKEAAGDFFDKTAYTTKVMRDINKGDFHAFPENVTAFQDVGKMTSMTNKAGQTFQKLEIRGAYKGRNGTFEFIKDSKGEINHRFFKPD